MIVLNNKFKKVLYWALSMTATLAMIETISSIFALYRYGSTYNEVVHNDVSAYAFTSGIIDNMGQFIISVLYQVFLSCSLYCLKRDNFFNHRNAYMLVCIAGVGLLASISRFLYALFYFTIPLDSIIDFLSFMAPSGFMFCIALIYLAAVRAEETEKLTI